MFKYRISGVRKKKELKEKFGEKIFGWKFLLRSCSLVQTLCLCFFLRVKVTEKKKFSKCFSERFEIEGCWKILKLKKMFGSCVSPLVGRHVVKHG